ESESIVGSAQEWNGEVTGNRARVVLRARRWLILRGGTCRCPGGMNRYPAGHRCQNDPLEDLGCARSFMDRRREYYRGLRRRWCAGLHLPLYRLPIVALHLVFVLQDLPVDFVG